MRRILLSLSVLAALLACAGPTAARAQPAGPEPGAPAAPEIVGAPSLVRVAAHRVTLRVHLGRPLRRRFDGELLATATIDGRVASLAGPAGGRRTFCYTAHAWLASTRPGRLVAVTVAVPGAGAVSALVAVGDSADRRPVPRGC